MGRHVFDVVVVPNQRVSIGSAFRSLLKALGEYSGIFFVKQKENSEQAAFFLGVFPKSLEALALREPLLNADSAPVVKSVFIAPKTLTSCTLRLWLLRLVFTEPFNRFLSVKVTIVVGLERKPAANSLFGI